MNAYDNQNYTREEIDIIVEKIRDSVRNNRYTIALNENWKENIAFINEYNIRSKTQKNILLQIRTEDFCHSLQNINRGYEYEVLYVFVPQVQLFQADGIEMNVDVYTKFNLIELHDGTRTIVVSFHQLNRPIDYLFK